MKTPFLGGSYSNDVAVNRLVNAYPEAAKEGGKEPAALVACPGFRLTFTPGFDFGASDYPVRGMFAASDGYVYIVIGAKLYKCTAGLAQVTSVAIPSATDADTGRIVFADNGTQLAFVDGRLGWVYTLASGAIVQITDVDFPNGCKQIAYIDTFGVVIDPGTQQFFISGANDFTAWSALDFASAEGDPDRAVALIVDHRELWIFGERSTEVFYNSGNADFPFERIQGGFIEQGCAAVHSVAKLDNSVFWLSQNKQGGGLVFRANGYSPQRVSTHALEEEIETYGDVSDAYAVAYQQRGHAFYMLFFPSVGKSWCHDAATGEWHERAGFANGDFTLYPVTCAIHSDGAVHVGSTNGDVFALDAAIHDYGGSPRKVLRAWRPFNSETERARVGDLRIDVQTGNPSNELAGAGLQADPQMMLRVSKDGGKTWPIERTASMGRVGEYANRVVFRRVGMARDFVLEVSVSDPVPVRISGAYI